MRRTLTAAATAALALGLVAGPAAAAKPDNGLSIVETVVAVSGDVGSGFDDDGSDFDVLRDALVVTGVIGVFDGTEYTVFAPNDQAFIDAANALGADVESEAGAFAFLATALGVGGIADVLAYHVTPGTVERNEIARPSTIEMLDGNTISTRGNKIQANGSDAGLVAPSRGVNVTDGQIYPIDFVLLP